jgi:hypothetical protein
MLRNFLLKLRYQAFRLIACFAPKGSPIDTILDSYTDWHEQQSESVAAPNARSRPES